MTSDQYRVVQWATGAVGKVALRHFLDSPVFDLVGVLVTNPEKVGKDAGELVQMASTGILAVNEPEAILALDADCVHFSPLRADIDMVCRLLRSGKNVVSPLGPFYPIERYRDDVEKIEAACRGGGVSFHGSGIQPGYIGDIMPLTLSRLCDRIDHIRVYEIVDYSINPSHWMEVMGFGCDPGELRRNPRRSPEAGHYISQSMAMCVEGLGKRMDHITTEIDYAVAMEDIAYAAGVIDRGTVAGQHYAWTGWVEGRPFITAYAIWVVGTQNIEPNWGTGDSRYTIVIEGDPGLELTLQGTAQADGRRSKPGIDWTSMAGVTAIPAVCNAPPGFVTHFDLGVVRPLGLIRTSGG
jgi:hypothetical protein